MTSVMSIPLSLETAKDDEIFASVELAERLSIVAPELSAQTSRAESVRTREQARGVDRAQHVT